MEAKPLFDKSMEELREAFVRSRFAEPVVFGRPDIAEWLAAQWLTTDRPKGPDEVTWSSFLPRGFLVPCVQYGEAYQHLNANATPLGDLDDSFGSIWSEREYGPVLSRFDAKALYWGDRLTVYAPHKEAMFIVQSNVNGGLDITRLGEKNVHAGADAVMDVIFAEWFRRRPKWRAARGFLCLALAEEIGYVCAKAEHDFDTAVAVSADGTRIIHADWAVPLPRHIIPESPSYVSSPGSGRVFPGAVFYDRKVREQVLLRTTFPSRGLTFDGCLQGADCLDAALVAEIVSEVWAAEILSSFPYLRDMQRGQFLVVVKPWPNRHGVKQPEAKILLTVEDLCPSPLPDGGIEVTV